MSKLTVREYAKINQVSVQYVYKQIKLGAVEVQEIDNKKYIVIEDKIDYEKKFNELQYKYELLKQELKGKEELIKTLNFTQNFMHKLIEYKSEVEEVSTKKNKKKKKDKDKKKKKKK